MAFIVKENELPNPTKIGLFRAVAVVARCAVGLARVRAVWALVLPSVGGFRKMPFVDLTVRSPRRSASCPVLCDRSLGKQYESSLP